MLSSSHSPPQCRAYGYCLICLLPRRSVPDTLQRITLGQTHWCQCTPLYTSCDLRDIMLCYCRWCFYRIHKIPLSLPGKYTRSAPAHRVTGHAFNLSVLPSIDIARVVHGVYCWFCCTYVICLLLTVKLLNCSPSSMCCFWDCCNSAVDVLQLQSDLTDNV